MPGKRKLLIVDDQPINLKILEKLLQEEYRLVFAKNGKQALAELKRAGGSISAVLLDLLMPEMDGFEVLRSLRGTGEFLQLPVIVTTQADGEENEIRALALGASDFVSKPYNAQILRHRLHNLIAMHEATYTVRMVERDTLTGLYNEDAFYTLAARRLRADAEQKYDIIALDIERFSLINDTFGMEEGDRLLRYTADALKQQVPLRLGGSARNGDRFFILLARLPGQAEQLQQKMLEVLSNYPLERRVTAKFGIYPVESRSPSIATMCEGAVLALKRAKAQYDVTSYRYDKSLHKQIVFEQRIITDMAVALTREEFCIYFQPKYRLSDGSLAGAEALVRWQHPEFGLLSPGQFVPVLERNGMITELDQYVWLHTCRHLARWKQGNQCTVPVSVNVSRRDIYRTNLAQVLGEALRQNNLEPQDLHLEITESAYTMDARQLVETVARLREMGFPIEMDDFGSGYSSLNTLAELPVDALKLDMGFIQLYNKKNNSGTIIDFVVELAHRLKLWVVIEGVETQEQLDFAIRADCDLVQGDYCSAPLEAEQFAAMMKQNRTCILNKV